MDGNRVTNAIQISKKLPDGTIVVIGADSPTDFEANVTGLLGTASGVYDEIASAFGGVTHAQAIASVASQLGGQVISDLPPALQPNWQQPVALPAPAYVRGQPYQQPQQPVAQPAPAQVQGIDPKTGRKLLGDLCPHGQKVLRTGVSGRGPWAAYMCPSPKGTADQCEPEWCR